jgi:hypothetical protein
MSAESVSCITIVVISALMLVYYIIKIISDLLREIGRRK